MDFEVHSKQLQSISSRIQNSSGSIQRYSHRIRSTATGLRGMNSALDAIAGHLQNLADGTDREASHTQKYGSSLREIANQYIRTEAAIVGSASGGTENTADRSSQTKSTNGGFAKKVQDYLDNQDWSQITTPDEVVAILQWMFPGIPSGILWIFARDYIEKHQPYEKKVEIMYDKASGKAKEVYDRFKDDIKMEEIPDPTDPNEEKPVSHYRRGSNTLYINMDDDMSDKRGAASVYYHEYGHYVVDRMGWIKRDGTLSPEFAKYENAVKQDVQAYIDRIESGVRQKYQNMGYSGDQLERMVQTGTRNELSNILGGKNMHVLDGVSDMIDAQTNSKYQITYRHPIEDNGRTYWDNDHTRQANEAFAEMYSADFCANDQAEIDFIRENFPNAYREYQNLLNSAAK